jgi:hypothetical protein
MNAQNSKMERSIEFYGSISFCTIPPRDRSGGPDSNLRSGERTFVSYSETSISVRGLAGCWPILLFILL